jgi:hypothetical protein
MKVDYKFRNMSLVAFDNGVVKGEGFIVGACDTGHPIIGITYMVDTVDCNVSLPNDTYPFEILAISECHLTELKKFTPWKGTSRYEVSRLNRQTT